MPHYGSTWQISRHLPFWHWWVYRQCPLCRILYSSHRHIYLYSTRVWGNLQKIVSSECFCCCSRVDAEWRLWCCSGEWWIGWDDAIHLWRSHYGLRGEIIGRFVKHVFEEPFGTIHVRTIVAKLEDRNPAKDRIPLLSADAMDQLFTHYKRYGNINLIIIKENKKK